MNTTINATACSLLLACSTAALGGQDTTSSNDAANNAQQTANQNNDQDDNQAGDDVTGDTTGDDRARANTIVVTARKWAELLREVPQSISVVDSQTIEDGGIRDMRQAAELVPNAFFTEFTARRLSFPTFRGISTGVGDPSVLTYIDGVPQLSISSTNMNLVDVDQIDFMRGPQGTLFGRNAIGGVIKVDTKRPSNTPTVHGSTTWGNYELQEHTLGYSGPLIDDTLYLGLTGMYSQRDGYTFNTVTGNHPDERRSTFGRARLLYTPDDRNEIGFTSYAERSRDGGFVLSPLPGITATPHQIANDFEGFANRDVLSNALTWTHYGDDIEITSVSSFVDWEIEEESDFDFSFIDGVRRFTAESQRYFYQELRATSAEDRPVELGDNMTMRWIVGGTVFASDSGRSAANQFRPGGAGILFPPGMVGTSLDAGDFDDLGLAAFGQATVTIDDALDLTAGLRLDFERKEGDITNQFFDGGGALVASTTRNESRDFDEFAPNFSAAYRFSEDLMVYGRAARGFKAGGFNLAAPAGSESFDTEISWTFETGVKTSLWEDRIALSAAIFYIDWSDLQLSLFDAVAGGYTSNAGQATSKGFELEATARVCQGFDLFAGFGYADAQFDQFVDQFGSDVSGNKLAFVPKTTFNAGAQFSGDLGGGFQWFARAEYVNLGTYFFDAGNLESESYGLANFRLGVECNNVRIAGWMRNAFDEDYVQVALQPSPVDPTTFVGENGAPQTYGVTLSIAF